MQTAGTLSGPCRFRVHFARASDFWQIPGKNLATFSQSLPEFCRIFPIRPRRNVRGPDRVPGGSRQGPRSLHFRGKRPIPRLPELAHAAPLGLRPLSATSPLWSRSASSKSRFAAAASSLRRDVRSKSFSAPRERGVNSCRGLLPMTPRSVEKAAVPSAGFAVAAFARARCASKIAGFITL